MTDALNNTTAPVVIGAFQAKTELSRLLRQARAGKRFIITQRGEPVAELRPVELPRPGVGWGDLAGEIRVAADFQTDIADLADYLR